MATPELALAPVESWQQQLQGALRSPGALALALGLDVEALPLARGSAAQFPLLVPRAFVARMEPGNPRDPLLLQVLSSAEEDVTAPGFSANPVGELDRYADRPGLIHKYAGRALLVATGQCAVHCRYCFRRHYPYDENALSRANRLQHVDDLLADPDIGEIILSGGDPLLLSDRELAQITERLAASDRRVTLRLHTRLPVVIPDRVTDALLEALGADGPAVVLVLHANHPREIDGPTARAIGRLRATGVTVLNQSVLLAGINDDARVLAELSDALFAAGALPYYLHQLDRVAGAAHFEVGDEQARRIVGRLAALRPGYLVPRLMREVAGATSKRELAPLYD